MQTDRSDNLVTPQRVIHSQKSNLLNWILVSIAKQKDLPQSKYDLAKDRYEAVANWLDNAPDSDPLSQIKIKIYPIGSFLSGTPVKPFAGDEFDLDMAGELQLNYADYHDPRAAVDIFESRIRANKKYDLIAERKTRVIRLNYSGDFHLDFMPCFPKELWNKNCSQIKIPHKLTNTLYDYKDSDPTGFNLYFKKQADLISHKTVVLNERLDNEISPLPAPLIDKKPLELALQALKSARNFYFIDDDEGRKGVKTVILQALLAKVYDGQQNVFFILKNAVNWMYGNYYYENNPKILNPINSNEDFAEKWRSDPHRIGLKKFKGFLAFMKHQMDLVDSVDGGFKELSQVLSKIFGEGEVRKAFEEASELMTSQTQKKLIGITSAGLITSAKVIGSTPIKPHKFYGSK